MRFLAHLVKFEAACSLKKYIRILDPKIFVPDHPRTPRKSELRIQILTQQVYGSWKKKKFKHWSLLCVPHLE